MQPSASDAQTSVCITQRPDLLTALACAIAVVICVLSAQPFGGLPYNDDFSYMYSALRVAQTGHMAYTGWGAPTLVLQAYWGALWIKCFGFSFGVLRLSMLPLDAACAIAIYALCRRAGLRPCLAAFATLSVVLCPLFLAGAGSFMTDVPGQLFITLPLIAILCAGLAPTRRSAIRWIATSLALVLLGGLERQTVWMAALAGLPAVAWYRRRDTAVVATALAAWLATIAGAVVTLHWIAAQPYAVPEEYFNPRILNPHAVHNLVANSIGLWLTIAGGVIPVWLVAAGTVPRMSRRQLTASVIIFVLILLLRSHWQAPANAPWIGNTITYNGLLGAIPLGPGRSPLLPSGHLWPVFSITVYFAISFGLVALIAALHKIISNLFNLTPIQFSIAALWLFALGYFLLLLPHCAFNRAYDRYTLPLFPCIAIPLLISVQLKSSINYRLIAIAWAVLALLAFVGVSALQETLGLGRARLAAAQTLEQSGIPRAQIDAGVEYDFWTQLQQAGYVNDPRIVNPPNTFKPGVGPIPAFEPQYRVEFKARKLADDEQPTNFPPITYFSYLPPFHRTLVIRKILESGKESAPIQPALSPP